MYKPELTDKHHQLAKGTGTWVGEETMPPGVWIPKEITAQGRREVRIGLGGFALITDYTQTTDGVVTYEGHGVTLWDATEECYVMHWFDSAGSPFLVQGRLRGRRPDDDRIRLRWGQDAQSHGVPRREFDARDL